MTNMKRSDIDLSELERWQYDGTKMSSNKNESTNDDEEKLCHPSCRQFIFRTKIGLIPFILFGNGFIAFWAKLFFSPFCEYKTIKTMFRWRLHMCWMRFKWDFNEKSLKLARWPHFSDALSLHRSCSFDVGRCCFDVNKCHSIFAERISCHSLRNNNSLIRCYGLYIRQELSLSTWIRYLIFVVELLWLTNPSQIYNSQVARVITHFKRETYWNPRKREKKQK